MQSRTRAAQEMRSVQLRGTPAPPSASIAALTCAQHTAFHQA
jgi:hypothetical protein